MLWTVCYEELWIKRFHSHRVYNYPANKNDNSVRSFSFNHALEKLATCMAIMRTFPGIWQLPGRTVYWCLHCEVSHTWCRVHLPPSCRSSQIPASSSRRDFACTQCMQHDSMIASNDNRFWETGETTTTTTTTTTTMTTTMTMTMMTTYLDWSWRSRRQQFNAVKKLPHRPTLR